MELKARFDVTYMEEAIVFLASLPEKVQDKIAFNISKSRYFMDKELFKKLNDNIWGIPHPLSGHDVQVAGIL